MKNLIIKCVLFLLVPTIALSAPADVATTDTVADGLSVTITGSGFGAKATPEPLKFTKFESDTVGQMPTGWSTANSPSTNSSVTAANSHSGSKALDTSAIGKTSDYFPRVGWDLGTTIPFGGDLYLSAWVYMNRDTSTLAGFNWKGPIVASDTYYYWRTPGVATVETATGFAGFFGIDNYLFGPTKVNEWFNSSVTQHYSDGAISVVSPGTAPGWPSDAFAFGEWQRIEWIWKTSSAASVADGTVTVNRIGRVAGENIASGTGHISYGPNNNHWRYVGLPQGFTNILGGTLNLNMYFDEVYIDNSLARVELCDNGTWADRSQCEIQSINTWGSGEIGATVNSGAFAAGATVYLYVIDATGTVSPASDAIVLGSVPPTTGSTTLISPGNLRITLGSTPIQ